uniref:Mucin-2-like n=1 Tax=Pygocentrus nattereri TaxID=42514 RepID=A0A3B4DFV1_PYGNA
MALQGALLGVIILLSGQFCSMSRAETNVCKTYGSGVIQSFSKTLFYLKSTCPVTLTRFTLLGVNCDVTVQRGSTGLMTRVEILVNKVTTVLQDGKVTVEGNSISLPFEHTYQHVYQYGVYIKLRSKVLPFSVTWRNHSEGVSSLWMQLDSPLVDGMTGMCGLKNSATLGQFTSTNVISDGKCITEDSLKPPQPSAVCEVLSYAIGCPTSAVTYLGLCSLSMFKNINVDAKCAFFEEVARWCGNQSRLWPVWRQKTSCKPPTCPGDLKYQELGPPFAPTCTSPQPPSDILISTCLPPPGTVLNDRAEGYHCVTVKDCPCVYGGKTYPPGAQRNSKCQSCVCVQGKWTCSANVCPPTCNIEGQFVTTFDGKQYSVPGKCTYVAARGFKWKVAVKFSDTDASIAEMYLEVYQEKYTFSSHSVKLGQDEITDLSQTDYTTVFWQSSMFVQVQTSFGMKMKVQVFPEIQLYLYLPPTEKTTGLCGTYNNDTEDDFTTSSGIVENAVLPFSQSWTMGGCSPPDSSICINTEKEIFAEEKCSLLRNTSSMFARCHDYVPVSMFFDACVHRTCQCTSGLKDCLCVALSNYVKACASQGINIGDWRAETGCNIVCNGNLRFSYNMQACNQTCRSLTGRDPTCEVQVDPVEGCGCMPGTHLNTPQECSPSTLCMCHYQGGSTRPGPVTIDGRECMCENGNLSCSPICDCPGGKLCVHCAQAKVNTAQKTCESLSKPFSVDENCTSGCYCPAGLFEDHNGTCVTQENCTCEFSGSVYASGQSVETNCKKCICRGGQWYCEGEPCPGVCEVFGNGQYNTFDSMWYRFDGNCQYTLVEDATGDGHRQFAVRVESVPCCDEALTCSRAISVDLQDVVTLILRDMNVTQTLKAGWQLQAQPLYSIHTVGLHIIISVPDLGLTVIWDKNTRVKIKLQARWKGKVRGLCGNFDGKVMNDLLTSSSSVVFSTLEFGNSWKTAVPPCSDVTQEVFPCERHSYCEAWAQRRCMILQSDTFRDCHLKVDPTHYYQACILESCSCEFEGRFLGFCTAVAAYAEACTAQNVCIKWRTPDLCPVYCDYYNEESKYGWHYEPCGQIETCGKKHRLTGRLEGCYPKCSAEMPYFDENTRKCSTLDNCTCVFNNTVIRPGDKVTTYKECCECIGGQIICGDCETPTPAKKIIIYTTGTTTTTTTEISSTTGKTKPATSLITATSRTTVIKRTTETPGMTKQTETTNKQETTLTTTSTTEKIATTERIVPTTVQTTTIPETTVTITTSVIPGTTGRTETTTTLETTVATTPMTETPGTTEKTEPITPQTTSIPETTVTTTSSEIPGTTEGTETTTSQTTTIPETPETTVTTTTSEIPSTTEETETTTSQTTTIPETTVTTTTSEIPGTTEGTETTTSQTTTIPETTVTTTTSEIPGTTEVTETTTSQTTTIPETPETTVTTTTSEIPGTTEVTETTTSQTTTIPETTVTTTTSEIPGTTEVTETTTSQTTTIPETPETTVTTTTSEIPGTTEVTETTTSQTTTIPETTVTTTTSEIPGTTEGTETTTSQTTTVPETPETTVTTTTSEIPGTTEVTETTTSQTTTIPETPETTVTTTTSEIPGTTEVTETTTSQTTTIPETTVTTTTSEIPGTTEGTETTTSQTTTVPETPETTVTTTTSEIPGTTEGTETTTSQTTTVPETPETTVTTTTSEIPSTTEETETTTSQTTTIPETTVTTTTSEIPGTTEGTETTTSQTTTIPETTVTTTTSEIPGTTEGTKTTTSQTTTIPETTVTTTTSEIPGTTEGTEITTSQTTTIPETTVTTTTSERQSTTEVTETTTSQTTTIPETPETTVTIITSKVPGTTIPKTMVTTTPMTETPGTTKGTESTPLVLTLPPVSTKSPYTSGQQSVVTTLPVTSTQYTTVGFCRDPLRNQSWPSGAEWKEDCFYKTCRNGTIEMRPVTCPALVPPVCREDLMQVVKNEEGCCEIWQCDCQCELYGDPHYISFSGTTFDFLENCTYTLMKEKIPRHHLSIAVDNYYSTSLLFGSSVKGVVLKYQNDTVTLQFNTDNYTVEATMNGILVQPPYKENGIRFESTNFKVFVYIDKIRSHISFDPDNTLQITLAMEHFRDNTVGQCGVCGGPSCVRRNGRAESDDCCNMTAYDWVEKDPLKPHCDYVPKDLPCVPVTPPPPPPPCVAPLCDLLRHEVFHECTRSLDVETLVTNCRFDYCMVNRNMSICSPLQHLSERCKRLGFCVHWRNLTMGACDVTCPGGMIFDECRSTPDDVCQSGLRVQGKFGTDSMRSGCFCPGNTWLADEHKTFCVSECTKCKGPLGEPMLAGAVWESNCHICTCNNQTLTEECIPMPPAPDPICGADSMLVSGCCGNQICVEKTCEYNGQKYKVGDTWTDHSRPCVSFSCTSAGTEIERRVCPEQSCSEELRVWDEHHCCYSCNVTCAVRITKMTIKVDDCSQEVELPNCEGYCPSKSLMVRSGKILQLEQERRCCREKNYEIRRLSLSCKGATPNHYTYNHITSCDCLPDA